LTISILNKPVRILGAAIISLTLLTGCSSSTTSTTPSGESKEMMGEVKSDAFGDGKITPGNPAKGILPQRSDGTPRYLDVSIEYPQGAAFVQGFRQIFPNLDEDEYRKGAKYPLRNAQEVCGSLQLDLKTPQSLANNVRSRVKLSINKEVTQAQANAVYNLAIDSVCPVYADKKLP
jgi:hypothetical protein